MLKKLTVSNFKSIRHIEVEFGNMTAFIGANNSGKTSIMTALESLLGDRWPASIPITQDDFYR